ncbi:G-patch domain and KOW motifs-containing protein [Contarinia nasturtii]|uniref:G-patch domain and KOW motifs-containing protein n=1 Tax=Contarinia nasturtii TaxID=265458 RepID=UPI0012D4B82E|nr:G-patch domain and KOW motifs-containing protein [Contarinia nasturtii]
MSEKKISFGFKQVKKQPVLLPNKIGDDKDKKNDIELIQCLEGQTIKLVNEKKNEDEKPLVIPLLNSQKTSSALASLRNLKTILNEEEQNDDANSANKVDAKSTEVTQQNAPMTIEQRVVTELLNEAKNIEENVDIYGDKLTLPMAADKLPLDGAKQSSMDDYASIPIDKFGMAMLRGMGLKDEEIISKKNKDPELRPRGMGLGADKIVKKVKPLVAPAQNEKLEIKKNAYVRILAGKNKYLYGQIEGLDDQACRVIVRLAVGGAREALNEFMVQPVSKQEFLQYGKVINSAKYEEYIRKNDEKELKQEVKKEVKHEGGESRSISRERDESSSRSRREPSPHESKMKSDRNDESNSRHRSRERSNDRSREKSQRSPSHDRYKSKEIDHNSYKSPYDSRRSRSTEKYSNKPSSSTRRERSTDRFRNRSTDDKYRRHHEKSRSPNKRCSSSDSDSSDDSRHNKRSHHKKSKKKHKKKTSKAYYSSDDGDSHNYKKKTKKSKRQRSRSRGRR